MRSSQAYLLAAGEGRRAGGPKAWRLCEGGPALGRQVDFLLTRFKPRSVAVSIQESWRDRCLAIHPDVCWVGVDPRQTPLGALQALISACPMRSSAFLHHVDMPVWEPELFELLDRAADNADAVIPVYAGRKGHPVLLSQALGPHILSLDPKTQRLDHWLRRRQTRAVDMPFSCVLENQNTA